MRVWFEAGYLSGSLLISFTRVFAEDDEPVEPDDEDYFPLGEMFPDSANAFAELPAYSDNLGEGEEEVDLGVMQEITGERSPFFVNMATEVSTSKS